MLVERIASRLPICISWYKIGDGVEEVCQSDIKRLKHPATI